MADAANTADRMEQAVRDALDRLLMGQPEDAQNRRLMARQKRLHDRAQINMRMLCRESGLSPTTLYKRFPWVREHIKETSATVAATALPSSDREVIDDQDSEIRDLKRQVARLKAELHQVTQANIILAEKLHGAEDARQAAVNAGRKRKPFPEGNVERLDGRS